MDYKNSGVDVQAGRAFVERIRSSVEDTHDSEVIGGLGGFGGMIRVPKGLSNPVLVAGTDGVGTKLELAQEYKSHFGVGIDLVAMCINDVITSAARPLFFLDYVATGKLSQEDMASVVEGISFGCKYSKCVLLGGETAEMPGFYPQGTYDLAGFCVGLVDESQIVNGERINSGDHIIGIESSGVHSNGFSLVRNILRKNNVDEKTVYHNGDKPIIESLLTPTSIYSKLVDNLLVNNLSIKGMAHITGGGLPENLPRCIPKGLGAYVDTTTWVRPPIFHWLQKAGQIPDIELWHTFNLGIGFCLVTSSECVDPALAVCKENGFDARVIGHIEDHSSSNDRLRLSALSI